MCSGEGLLYLGQLMIAFKRYGKTVHDEQDGFYLFGLLFIKTGIGLAVLTWRE